MRNVKLIKDDRMVASDTLELIVFAANYAACLENSEKIVVPDDTVLMQSIVDCYNVWDNMDDPPSWEEYIEVWLLREFGPKTVYVLVSETKQFGFTDLYGEMAAPAVEVIGVYDTKPAAEKAMQAEDDALSNTAEIADGKDLEEIHNTELRIMEMVLQ